MIVSFYSYKGGVGRSKVCANIAAYLCHQRSKRILLWDWDFEAPGLHYFFKNDAESKPNWMPGVIEILESDGKPGTLEMLEKYTHLMRSKDEVRKSDIQFFLEGSFIPLAKQVRIDTQSEAEGRIDLIPAGNYADRYVSRVNAFDWPEFTYQLDGTLFIELLKEHIKEALLGQQYDFVFIDSRTGITDYSGYCNIQLPDINVVIMAANQQNISGSRRIVDQIVKSEYVQQNFRKKFILPVLSRLDSGHPHYEDWLKIFTNEFSFLLRTLDSEIDDRFLKDIFLDFYTTNTLLKYVPTYSAGEHVLFTEEYKRISPGSFRAKFANLAEYLLQLQQYQVIFLFKEISKKDWAEYAERWKNEDMKEKAAKAFTYAEQDEDAIKFGGTVQSYRRRGLKFLKMNEYEAAISDFRAGLKISPDDIDSLLSLGNVLKQTKDYLAAITTFDKLRGLVDKEELDKEELEPKGLDINIDNYVSAQLTEEIRYQVFDSLGFCYLKIGDFDKAERALRKARTLRPERKETIRLLVTVLSEQGLYDQALKLCGESFDSSAGNYDTEMELLKGQILNLLGNMRKAVNTYKNISQQAPADYRPWIALGNIYYDVADYREAENHYKEATRIQPQLVNAWQKLINIAEAEDNVDKLYKYAVQAKAIAPDNIEIENKLIEAESKMPKSVKLVNQFYAISSKKFKIVFEDQEIHSLGRQVSRIIHTLLNYPNINFDMYLLYANTKVDAAVHQTATSDQAEDRGAQQILKYLNENLIRPHELESAKAKNELNVYAQRLKKGILLLEKCIIRYPDLELASVLQDYQYYYEEYFNEGLIEDSFSNSAYQQSVFVSKKTARERISKQLRYSYRYLEENGDGEFADYLRSVVSKTEEEGVHYYTFRPESATKPKWRTIKWELSAPNG